MDKTQAIGFFDSGLGGLSVLSAAIKQLPRERFIYLGDNANAPYGTKSDSEVRRLTLSAVKSLASHGIKGLVIACNTATGAAVEDLRAQYDFPVIGLEPALKPAAQDRRNGIILVMATPLTLGSDKFGLLFQRYGEHAVKLPCPGLMDFVERGEFSSPALSAYLEALFLPYRAETIDSVVLGCTHYLFIRQAIKAHLPEETRVFDSNDGVIRHLIRRLSEHRLLAGPDQTGSVELYSTGGDVKTAQMKAMLDWALRTL